MYIRYGKRTLDIVGATIILVATLPAMMLVALLIRIESPGPALFRQKRYGKDKQPFNVYKFRTMSTQAPRNMPTNDFHDAHTYITRVGRIIRKLSIDELPQLINVLQGHMSLVGPRPVVLTEISLINERDKYGANSVKPGITGWAQVNGRDELDDIAKAEMDGYYVDNFGFKMDAECVLKTIWVILSIAGHVEGHESVAKDNDRIATGE